jgi:hypothetical protein
VNKTDAKTLARLRRKDMPVYAGRAGGPHKDKSRYNRKTKHRKGWE